MGEKVSRSLEKMNKKTIDSDSDTKNNDDAPLSFRLSQILANDDDSIFNKKEIEEIDSLKSGIGKIVNENKNDQIQFLETQFDKIFKLYEDRLSILENYHQKIVDLKISPTRKTRILNVKKN